MKKANKNVEKEAKKMVTHFMYEFNKQFGVHPVVTYDLDDQKIEYQVTLEDLINVTNDVLNKDPDIELIPLINRDIKVRCRKSLIVTYRGCMCHIARRFNFNFTDIAREVYAANHTCVLHSRNRIQDLIDVKDYEVLYIYKKLEDELKTRYGTSGDVQLDNKSGNNS